MGGFHTLSVKLSVWNIFSTYAAASALCLCDQLINAIFDQKREEKGLSVRLGSLRLIRSFRNHLFGFHKGDLSMSSRGRKGRKEVSFNEFRFISPQHHLKMRRVKQLPGDTGASVSFFELPN